MAAAAPAGAAGAPGGSRKKEIYTYRAPWPVFSLASSQRTSPEHLFRFALGSFIEEYNNKVQIIQLDEERGEFVARCYFDHPYPTTKIMWAPEALADSPGGRDLLATSGDYLRLWRLTEDFECKQEALFNNNKTSDYCAPVTSFDWNAVEPSLVATCSIDTTVTVWDINVRKARTQLIAHDREVYDAAWSRSRDVFATVGAEGSLRVFDQRSLEHSTIMYETPTGSPLLRVAWNGLDTNYLAVVAADSARTAVLDVRLPSRPVAELPGHSSSVVSVAWAPHSACHICTAGEDYQALIWDLGGLGGGGGTGSRGLEDPILAYSAESEINSMVWSSSIQDWVTIAFDNKIQMLRV